MSNFVPPKRLVLDIETYGTPFNELDSDIQHYLTKGLDEEGAEAEKERTALNPFVGKIIAIGVYNVDLNTGSVLYEAPGQADLTTWIRIGDCTLIPCASEASICETFWKYFDYDDRFITFNGRQFDAPFLMIRSAINGVVVKRDLVGPRYEFRRNCDLREVLTSTGALSYKTRFGLDMACKAFGVTSSKSGGMNGSQVAEAYRAGRHEDIARYCFEDVRATAELYKKLEVTIPGLYQIAPLRPAVNA